jgi:ribosome maturation factor RimP
VGADSATRSRLVELLRPLVAGAGLDLEDLVVSRAGSRRLVRVVVDRDGGVDLDGVAAASRLVSEALDRRDGGDGGALPGPYVLEVSTPGVDRPLTAPRHWRRAVGRLVRAERAGAAPMVGRVVDADDEAATLDVDGAERRLPYPDVRHAVVQVEFRREEGA